MPKIVNPNWHPEASSQLTTAQVRNLRILLEATGPIKVKRNTRKSVSMDSLVRHELATVTADSDGTNTYLPSQKALEWKGKGYL